MIEGATHAIISLEELVNLSKKRRKEVKSEAQAKEETLSTILKHSTGVLFECEKKTAEMVDLLRTTRDTEVRRCILARDATNSIFEFGSNFD